jgi:MFS family permease
MVDAATFLVSVLFIAQLPSLAPVTKTVEEADEPEPGFWREFNEGLVYLFHHRTLLMAVGSMAAALFIIFTFDSLGVLALRALGIGEALFGLAVGSIGVGTALGAIAIGQWGKRLNPFTTMGIGQIGGGIVVAILGAAVMFHARGPGAWVIVYRLIGASAAAVFVPYGYVIQVETPPELMGRVFASASGIQTVFQLMAPPLGAVLAEIWGVGFVFTAAGIALALLGLVVFLLRPDVAPKASEDDAGLQTSAA